MSTEGKRIDMARGMDMSDLPMAGMPGMTTPTVDAESIALATLYRLHCAQSDKRGQFDAAFVAKAIRDLGVNPDKIDPYFA